MGETTQDLNVPRPAINDLRDLRAGDICFTDIGGLVPGVFPVKAGMLAIGERMRIGRISFDHVLIVERAAEPDQSWQADSWTPPRGVQAMPRGAEFVTLTEERHWNDRTAYCRLPESYPGQALDVAAIAREFVAAGVDYSFASYLALALWSRGRKTPKLEEWIDRRLPPRRVDLPGRGYTSSVRLPAEAICSVLVDQCWSLTGKRVIEGVAPQAVTPGRLGIDLWRRPGATWGGLGIPG